MKIIVDFVNSAINNYHIDSSMIQNVQGRLDEKWRLDGWISVLLSNRECIVLKFNNGVFMDRGFVVNDKKVLKVFGNHQIGDISYNEGQSIVVEGIIDLDHGSRFEGLILTDEKEGKIGIPFGYGEMYDDHGILLYKGIVINWKRFGYGTSYHNNGMKEYEGYWCDDNRFGSGKVYDRYGKFVKECKWANGIENDIEEYEGDGSEPLTKGMKHLKLTDDCVLKDWDLSWFMNLESIEIGDDCFESVKTFKIDGLNRLKRVKIGKNSFTESKYDSGNDESKSFQILNCESLESIEIGEFSFRGFAGDFVLRNLPQLQSIHIDSRCFGSGKIYKIDGLNRLKTIKIGDNSFTQKKNAWRLVSDKSKSFHILNCESLESIEIGEYCFSDFAGEFELKNLPQLQSIQIGTIGSYSCNFRDSSFVIRGIELI